MPLPHRREYARSATIFLCCLAPFVAIAVSLTVRLVWLTIRWHRCDYSALGELLLVIVIAFGESIAFFELQSASRDRDFEIWDKLQKLWTEEEFVKERGFIFGRLDITPKGNAVKFEGEEAKRALDICRKMDEFAHLANFFGNDEVIRVWGNPLAKAWLALKQTIEDERAGPAKWSDKWVAFYTLGELALEKLTAEGKHPLKQDT